MRNKKLHYLNCRRCYELKKRKESKKRLNFGQIYINQLTPFRSLLNTEGIFHTNPRLHFEGAVPSGLRARILKTDQPRRVRLERVRTEPDCPSKKCQTAAGGAASDRPSCSSSSWSTKEKQHFLNIVHNHISQVRLKLFVLLQIVTLQLC